MRRMSACLICLADVLVIAACAGCGALGQPQTTPGTAVSSHSASPSPACRRADPARPCPGYALRVTGLTSQAGTMPGTVTTIFFRNAGARTCTLDGWPGLAIRGPATVRTAVAVRDLSAAGAWAIARTRVALRPGASAAASLLISAPAGAARCATVSWAVTPPRAPGPVTVLPSPAHLRICADDTIAVSPGLSRPAVTGSLRAVPRAQPHVIGVNLVKVATEAVQHAVPA